MSVILSTPANITQYLKKKKKSQSRGLLLCQGIKRAVHKQMACDKKKEFIHKRETDKVSHYIIIT